MATHTTLEALVERVMTETERKFDLLADTRRMSVDVASDLDEVTLIVDQTSGVTALNLSDHALGQMATDLEIPKRYFDRMKVEAPDLFQTNVHHWMYETPKRKLVRAYKGDPDTGRAWLSDRYRRLDNIEIATKLLPEFGSLGTEVKFHEAAITETKFYLRAVFPSLERAVKVGDPVQWGVQIRNSEVGDGTFAIENFVLRLACLNGMVVAKVLNARHIGKRIDEALSDEAIRADDKAFWLAARNMLRASLDEAKFEEVVRSLQGTTDGAVITAPIAATERLAQTFSLSDVEKESVLTLLAVNGDMTRWGALNAITAAAKSVESFDRQNEMEKMGWTMAEMPEREWARIAVTV